LVPESAEAVKSSSSSTSPTSRSELSSSRKSSCASSRTPFLYTFSSNPSGGPTARLPFTRVSPMRITSSHALAGFGNTVGIFKFTSSWISVRILTCISLCILFWNCFLFAPTLLVLITQLFCKPFHLYAPDRVEKFGKPACRQKRFCRNTYSCVYWTHQPRRGKDSSFSTIFILGYLVHQRCLREVTQCRFFETRHTLRQLAIERANVASFPYRYIIIDYHWLSPRMRYRTTETNKAFFCCSRATCYLHDGLMAYGVHHPGRVALNIAFDINNRSRAGL